MNLRTFGRPDEGGRGRRPWLVVTGAVLIVGALVLLVVLATSDGQPTETVESAPASSTLPVTTAPSSTMTVATTVLAASTSTPAADTTSTVTPASDATGAPGGLEPDCIERDPDPGRPTSWTPWPGRDELSPLGPEPSFVFDLPEQRTPNSDGLEPVYAGVSLVPGGFLVQVRADVGESMLTLVETDGTVRWQRCLNASPSVLTSAVAERAVLLQPEYRPAGGDTWTLSTVSLDDGRPGPLLDGALGERTQLAASFEAGAVFVHRAPHLVDEANDRMALIDPVSMKVVDVPYPPGTNGTVASQLFLESNWWTGQLVRREAVDGRTVVTAVLVDGSWRTDAAITAAQPVGYYFTGDRGDSGASGWSLQYRDGSGRILWERPDIVNPGGEGFSSGVAGDVVVARGCVAPSSETCADPGADWTLYGLDTATGETRWERGGAWDVSLIADGRALIEEISEIPGPWSMIETSTGELVATDQMWADPTAFDYECCGGGEYVHVGVEGDVVIASNYGRVALWFPKDRSTPTRQITLP